MKPPVHIFYTAFLWFSIYCAYCEEMSGMHEYIMHGNRRPNIDMFTNKEENSGSLHEFDIKELLKSHMPTFDALLVKAGSQVTPNNNRHLVFDLNSDKSILKPVTTENFITPIIPSEKIKHPSIVNLNNYLSTTEYPTERKLNVMENTMTKLNQGNVKSNKTFSSTLSNQAEVESEQPLLYDEESLSSTNPLSISNDFEQPEETNPILYVYSDTLYEFYDNFLTLSSIVSTPMHTRDYSEQDPIISPTASIKVGNKHINTAISFISDQIPLENELLIPIMDSVLLLGFSLAHISSSQYLMQSHSLNYSSSVLFLPKHKNISSSASFMVPGFDAFNNASPYVPPKKKTRTPKVMESQLPYDIETSTNVMGWNTVTNRTATTSQTFLSESIITSSYNDILQFSNDHVQSYLDTVNQVIDKTVLTPSWEIYVESTMVYTLSSFYDSVGLETYETFSNNYYDEDLFNRPLDYYITPSSLSPSSLWLPNSVFYNIIQWPISNKTIDIKQDFQEYGLATAAIVGIVLGVCGFILLICFIIFFLYRRGTTIKKISDYDESISYWDDNLTLSYVNGHVELPKETSEEMISLDNDSFLNSLEKLDGLTIANYWAHSSKNTQL